MTYSPSLVQITDIRNTFTPALDSDDVSDNEILAQIEITETYIKYAWYNGSMPSAAEGKVPAWCMVISKILNSNSNIYKKYAVPSRMKLNDETIDTPQHGTGNHKTVKEVANSWEDMALQILKANCTSWKVRKVNK